MAPVPVLEQESVLDLSQRTPDASVVSNDASRENDTQNQSRIDPNSSSSTTQ